MLIVATKGKNNTQIPIKYISKSTGYIRTKGRNMKMKKKPNKIYLQNLQRFSPSIWFLSIISFDCLKNLIKYI